MTEPLEVGAGKWFGEDVRRVVGRAHTRHLEFTVVHKLLDIVEPYSDMLYSRVVFLILCELCSSIVVTIKWGWFGGF